MSLTIATTSAMGSPPDHEPPVAIIYDLEEALDLLAALEDARDALADTDHLAVLTQVEHEVTALSRTLGFDEGGSDAY